MNFDVRLKVYYYDNNVLFWLFCFNSERSFSMSLALRLKKQYNVSALYFLLREYAYDSVVYTLEKLLT